MVTGADEYLQMVASSGTNNNTNIEMTDHNHKDDNPGGIKLTLQRWRHQCQQQQQDPCSHPHSETCAREQKSIEQVLLWLGADGFLWQIISAFRFRYVHWTKVLNETQTDITQNLEPTDKTTPFYSQPNFSMFVGRNTTLANKDHRLTILTFRNRP